MQADREQRTPGSEAGHAACVRRLGAISEVTAEAWNHLIPGGNPFVDHRFLNTLECLGLVGPGSGWIPRHLGLWRGDDLAAALPLYEKDQSYGEFVFDWAWAEAYHRAGLPYYPKLVSAVPFSPVPGPRLLAASEADFEFARPLLLAEAGAMLAEVGGSSLHILFPDARQAHAFPERDLALRQDCRFLWKNPGYGSFEEFLADFSSKQRKNIRRERRTVADAGVRFTWREGDTLSPEAWQQIHALCATTFRSRGHHPYLNAVFFHDLSAAMPGQVLVSLARQEHVTVAAAVFLRDGGGLYGRYWGSAADIDFLHFETCYYQGIEYAISRKLEFFDPGTQGEHKLRRGFAPVPSFSLHRFAHPVMDDAIRDWLARERRLVSNYIQTCAASLPYRTGSGSSTQ